MSYTLDLPPHPKMPMPNLSRVQQIRRLTIFLVTVPALVLFPFVRSVWDWQGPVQEWVENIGFSLVLVAILGRGWASLYIGGRKMRDLVQRGPFSVMRNPLYFFSFVGAFGMGAASGSVVLASAVLFFAYVVFRDVVRKEEAALHILFGEPYADYCKRVPRFLPNPLLWHDDEVLEIQPKRVIRTLIDALPFVLAMPMFEVIGMLQVDGVLPVLLYLP